MQTLHSVHSSESESLERIDRMHSAVAGIFIIMQQDSKEKSILDLILLGLNIWNIWNSPVHRLQYITSRLQAHIMQSFLLLNLAWQTDMRAKFGLADRYEGYQAERRESGHVRLLVARHPLRIQCAWTTQKLLRRKIPPTFLPVYILNCTPAPDSFVNLASRAAPFNPLNAEFVDRIVRVPGSPIYWCAWGLKTQQVYGAPHGYDQA